MGCTRRKRTERENLIRIIVVIRGHERNMRKERKKEREEKDVSKEEKVEKE